MNVQVLILFFTILCKRLIKSLAHSIIKASRTINEINNNNNGEKIRSTCIDPGLAHHLFSSSSHLVQSGTVLEPFNLFSVVSVGQWSFPSFTFLGVDSQGDVLTWGQFGQTDNVNSVVWSDLVVGSWVNEVQWQQTLLLQVGFVDTSEGLGDDGETTQESWFQGSVFSGGTFTEVFTTNDNPLDTSVSVVNGGVWNTLPFTSVQVLDVVGLVVFSVDGTNHVVVGDVFQVTSVLQPRTGHRDVIGGGLTLGLDQDWHVFGILTVPWLEWSQLLQSVGGWGNLDIDGFSVGWWGLVGVFTGIVTLDCEVSVVGGDNGVLVTLLDVLSVPLTDTWTTGVGQDNTTEFFEGLQLTVSGNGGSDLFGTWGNSEQGLGLDTVLGGISDDGSGSGHVFVRRVGTGTDQTNLDFQWPVLGNGNFLNLGDWGGEIWGEWTVDVWFQGVQVDFNDFVVFSTFVGLQEVLLVQVGKGRDLVSTSGVQVFSHWLVVWEDRGGGTDFSTHVTDGTHTGTRESVDTFTEVFDNLTSTTLDGGDTSQLQDDILWRGPAVHLTSQLDT
ncbi:hypothetical protein WICPIJ_007899 [Wickerhamomyces pijperi]|uniref:Uncharacterized protein n=1 Tax=Wickerhamomyces pijperi TaxID=599730 RepID=A0A9P8TJI4_WICPI|nr:hypothetical protein WICPIJ_007899 [Wickerhamomyces pijperi]